LAVFIYPYRGTITAFYCEEPKRHRPPKMGMFTWFLDWLLYMFWATHMNVTIVGLQSAGKTTLLRVLAGGEFTADSVPTVGFNKKVVKKGHVSISCWDLGGQPKFRTMWERYCRDVNAIVFVVDAADRDAAPMVKEELHSLLGKSTLEGIPLLVLGSKSDLQDKMSVDELIEALDLKKIVHREISCYAVSAKEYGPSLLLDFVDEAVRKCTVLITLTERPISMLYYSGSLQDLESDHTILEYKLDHISCLRR
jgi:ADP-ribosylation factor-like protein 8